MIFAVLAIGTGVVPPEVPTEPQPSAQMAASPRDGHGMTGGLPNCSLAVITVASAIAGSGRKY
jgi:hypothetical protein